MRKNVGSASMAGKEEKSNNDDRFTNFVYAVFLAVVLGAGTVIWNLISANAALDKRVTVLEVKCLPTPLLPQSGHP